MRSLSTSKESFKITGKLNSKVISESTRLTLANNSGKSSGSLMSFDSPEPIK